SKSCRLKDVVIREGDIITIDRTTGRVILGTVPLIPPMINEDFRRLLAWADEIRKLGVRANADTPEDAAKSRDFEAEGIGLCRTEHMFMAEDRLPHVQAAILAKTDEERAVFLSMRPSSTMSTAILRAAAAVLLPTLVWSI
ncbi:pyruvate, orthophosphate dikinase, partial [Candidatus Hakubella thermalkaliphila]